MRNAYGYTLDVSATQPPLSVESQEQAIKSHYDRKLARQFQFAGVFGDYADSQRLPFVNRPGGRALLERVQEHDLIMFSRLETAYNMRSDLLQLLGIIVGAKRVAVHFVAERLEVVDRHTADTLIAFLYQLNKTSL